MAKRYTLTAEFTTIEEEQGTLQNAGRELIEIVSADNATKGEGTTLLPGEKQVFSGEIKARSLDGKGTDCYLNVTDVILGGGGSGGSSDDESVTDPEIDDIYDD